MTARRLAVAALVAVATAVLASGAGGANGAGELAFYPQAGILWRDLYPNNFVDLDPGPGVRDFACGTQTYDGHTGIDTDLRELPRDGHRRAGLRRARRPRDLGAGRRVRP